MEQIETKTAKKLIGVISVYEDFMAVDLIIDENKKCCGAYVYDVINEKVEKDIFEGVITPDMLEAKVRFNEAERVELEEISRPLRKAEEELERAKKARKEKKDVTYTELKKLDKKVKEAIATKIQSSPKVIEAYLGVDSETH